MLSASEVESDFAQAEIRLNDIVISQDKRAITVLLDNPNKMEIAKMLAQSNDGQISDYALANGWGAIGVSRGGNALVWSGSQKCSLIFITEQGSD